MEIKLWIYVTPQEVTMAATVYETGWSIMNSSGAQADGFKKIYALELKGFMKKKGSH
jgi:hypothetical protein